MKNILMTRIDERLIHGQVATSWLKLVPANTIVVVDDVSANTAFLSRILKAACPKDIDLKIFTNEQACEYLKGEQENEKIFMLAKTPGPILYLMKQGIEIKEVILGNMGGNPSRKRISRDVNASDEEIEQLKQIILMGTPVFAQMIPADTKVNFSKVLGISK